MLLGSKSKSYGGRAKDSYQSSSEDDVNGGRNSVLRAFLICLNEFFNDGSNGDCSYA